jgi:phage gp36-like protein
MSLYCTQSDLVQRFGNDELVSLTDRDGSAGQIVEPVLNQAIADASATIDGYLGGRYTLPLSSIPQNLTRLACDIARYYLFDDSLGDEHQAAKRYTNAISYLKDIGSGRLQLGITQDSQQPQQTSTASMVSSGTVFGRDKSKGFI